MTTTNLDNCPACGRRIKDFDNNGMEADDGQRWCRDHFARHRPFKPVVVTRETARYYLGHSNGHNVNGVWIIGPVQIKVQVLEYLQHTDSYYVSLDGRHSFGGFAHHLPTSTHVGLIEDPREPFCPDGCTDLDDCEHLDRRS